MGHGVVAAGGRFRATSVGVKWTESSPIGDVTQPWFLYFFAVRVTPSGRVSETRCDEKSTTVSTTCARSLNGLVKPPTLAAASAGSRPVMKTAEQRIFAKPDVWWCRASPGGGLYSVSSSSAVARAISPSVDPSETGTSGASAELQAADKQVSVASVAAASRDWRIGTSSS